MTRNDGVTIECSVLGADRAVPTGAVSQADIEAVCNESGAGITREVLGALLFCFVVSVAVAMVVGVVAYRRGGTLAPGQVVGSQAR